MENARTLLTNWKLWVIVLAVIVVESMLRSQLGIVADSPQAKSLGFCMVVASVITACVWLGNSKAGIMLAVPTALASAAILSVMSLFTALAVKDVGAWGRFMVMSFMAVMQDTGLVLIVGVVGWLVYENRGKIFPLLNGLSQSSSSSSERPRLRHAVACPSCGAHLNPRKLWNLGEKCQNCMKPIGSFFEFPDQICSSCGGSLTKEPRWCHHCGLDQKAVTDQVGLPTHGGIGI